MRVGDDEMKTFERSLWSRLSIQFHQEPTSGHGLIGPRDCWQCETMMAAAEAAFILAVSRIPVKP